MAEEATIPLVKLPLESTVLPEKQLDEPTEVVENLTTDTREGKLEPDPELAENMSRFNESTDDAIKTPGLEESFEPTFFEPNRVAQPHTY